MYFVNDEILHLSLVTLPRVYRRSHTDGIAWSGKVINGASVADVELRYANTESIRKTSRSGLVFQFKFLPATVVVADT